MEKILIAFTFIFGSAAFAQPSKKVHTIASTITAIDLKSKLNVIASAEMEGRETATPGQKKAATYIENYFLQLGLQPATANGYQMYYPVYQDSVTGSSLTVNGNNFIIDEDYVLSLSSLSSGKWEDDSIVYASFGIVDSTINDYKTLNIKNKWVLVAEGTAEDADKPSGVREYNSYNPASVYAKMFRANAYGARGLIIVAKEIWRKNASSLKGNMYVKQSNNKNIPVIYVSYSVADTLLGKSLHSFADLKNITAGIYSSQFSFSCNTVTNTLQSSNVIGVLPSTDKKDEYILITAHYDHLGKRDSVIYYGADDDGSGTSGVLELAEAFVKAKQKGFALGRTIVFMMVSGEEKGLWGSEYYTSHPVFPLEKTSVDLNIDMIGRIDPNRQYGDSTNYIYTVGENKLSSDLIAISDSVNNTYSHLELDRKYNDPKDPNRFYYRSDHYNFAMQGVPVIFYFGGTHADYHQPTDTVDKINFELMAKRVKLIFYTALAMASRNNMLKRDIPIKR